ncbi:MAG TPA: hypothetical protein VM140_11255 [Burkholderiales bacterium]|nr:hypothetical protein [Burkholderiales bacterium]
MRKSFLFAVACALAMSSARADLADDLKNAADSVKRVKAQWTQGALPADVNLDPQIAALTKIIDDGKLNEAGRTVALYYRGDANLLVNAARVGANRPVNVDAAREALADYDRVIKQGKDIADWGVDVSNAAYYAGWIAQRYLSSVPLAYSYWEKCADMGHSGCLMTVALARVSGDGGVKVDVDQALALNSQVFNSGTNYGCAGAYAARNNALIIFFTKTKRPAGEALEWLDRSKRLFDSNSCARARFDIIEYLMRYSADDPKRGAQLQAAARHAETDDDRAILRYLANGDEDAFRAQIARNPTKAGKCDLHFIAMWNAEVNRNGGVARDHYKGMQDIGTEACGPELAYVKKFGR